MDFNDMKKIWDEQNQQSLYAINEEALHNNVIKKKNRAAFIADRSEVFTIGSLLISSAVIIAAMIYTTQLRIAPGVLAVFMLIMAGILYGKRRKRLAWQNTFDRTIMGDLEQAIANAEYQVQISKWSKYLLFVVAVVSIVDVYSYTDWWKSLLVLGFFVVVYYLAKWEYRTFYLSQRNNLIRMKEKLSSLDR